MIVVSDASPLNVLVRIGHAEPFWRNPSLRVEYPPS